MDVGIIGDQTEIRDRFVLDFVVVVEGQLGLQVLRGCLVYFQVAESDYRVVLFIAGV
jgi:hypothetical protein